MEVQELTLADLVVGLFIVYGTVVLVVVFGLLRGPGAGGLPGRSAKADAQGSREPRRTRRRGARFPF